MKKLALHYTCTPAALDASEKVWLDPEDAEAWKKIFDEKQKRLYSIIVEDYEADGVDEKALRGKDWYMILVEEDTETGKKARLGAVTIRRSRVFGKIDVKCS